MTFLSEYFNLQIQSEQKYKDVVVLIEKGSFYEAYGTDTIGNVKQVGKILNMMVTLHNKNFPMSETNPYMLGFPTVSSDKNIPVLVSRGMTIVLVHQQWDHFHKTVKERVITRVITPGTYIENPPSEYFYNICCVHRMGTIHHITVMDLSVGKVEVLTLVGNEELIWFIEYYNPIEIQVLCDEDCTELKRLFTGRTIYLKSSSHKENKLYFDRTCQEEILKKVNMDYNPQDIERVFIPSLVCLIDYVYTIHPMALTHMRFPQPCEFNDKLIMYNNATRQLDITSNEKNKGLFRIVNRTKTAMGKRMLKAQLLTPYFDITKLRAEYDKIDAYMERPDTLKEIQNVLSHIPDIDRLLKKLSMSGAAIYDIKTMYEVTKHVAALSNHLPGHIQVHGAMKKDIETHFDTETWNVKAGVYEKLDEVESCILALQSTMDECPTSEQITDQHLPNIFSSFNLLNLDNVSHLKLKNYQQIWSISPNWKSHFYLKKNDKQGYYIGCSSKGYKFLTATGFNKLWNVDTSVKTNVKLSTKHTESVLNAYDKRLEEKDIIYKEFVSTYIKDFVTKFHDKIEELSNAIAVLDCYVSKALIAVDNQYVRPLIEDGDVSFVDVKGMRHPIVEQCIDDVYVGNDVSLNHTESGGGMLLYGINGSGKSTFGKAVALNIILAQSGFFVAAEAFRYTPFKKLFVRINCDDDIYKGYSSFHVEMNELRTITRLADSQSIVIGDEVCKGTEEVSAISIVSGAIKWMTDNKITFVLATHLHKLLTIDFVKQLVESEQLQIKHVASTFDPINERLIFTRNLQNGNGDEIYGINVAKYILKCPEMHNWTMNATKQILNQKKSIVTNKKSKYNVRVLMDECEMCGSFENLHTHHIKHQKEFASHDKNKNVRTNLKVLCRTCHEAEHRDER